MVYGFAVLSVVFMDKISYKLPVFEGPLDLLLHLISKNKLNIYDIEISSLLDQYMEHIELMKTQDMDVASEFLEMAARLVYIKTISLLPKHEETEELKRELTGQLLEYQECKRIAAVMSEMISYDRFVREPEEFEIDMTYTGHHSSKLMYEAYLSAVGRGKRKLPPPPQVFSGIVARKIVSVNSRIIHVLRRLWRGATISYSSLFESSKEKSEMVATFLAVLELVKGKRIRINGEGDDATVKLSEVKRKWKPKNLEQ